MWGVFFYFILGHFSSVASADARPAVVQKSIRTLTQMIFQSPQLRYPSYAARLGTPSVGVVGYPQAPARGLPVNSVRPSLGYAYPSYQGGYSSGANYYPYNYYASGNYNYLRNLYGYPYSSTLYRPYGMPLAYGTGYGYPGYGGVYPPYATPYGQYPQYSAIPNGAASGYPNPYAQSVAYSNFNAFNSMMSGYNTPFTSPANYQRPMRFAGPITPLGGAFSPLSPVTSSSFIPEPGARRKATSKGPVGPLCGGNRLTGTYYNLPFRSKPESYKPYPMFYDRSNIKSLEGSVNVQGSGILEDGRTVLHYDGSRTKTPCPAYFGEVSVKGAGGSKNEDDPKGCLVPFFSIAADIDHYPFGTIIRVPELENQTVYLPPNRKPIQHPGYFIVGDVGGAIKGEGRFDFFTGSANRGTDNVFGINGPNPALRMKAHHDCDKTFEAITPNDPRYAAAFKKMWTAIKAASGNGPSQQVAGVEDSETGTNQ